MTKTETIIRYAGSATSVGRIFAALSEQGLCVLSVVGNAAGERDALEELRHKFPNAQQVKDAAALAPVFRQVEEVLAGERADLDVPLDLRGTPFQQRVWQTMRKLPRGQTWTYTELARRSGRPKAVRAAASACAANPVAIIVPCHRIVRSDGGLGGYRWGTPRKCDLLSREKVLAF